MLQCCSARSNTAGVGILLRLVDKALQLLAARFLFHLGEFDANSLHLVAAIGAGNARNIYRHDHAA